MSGFIEYVSIRNFKSIRDLRLDDCKRINLFLGFPNVGKSNILEALSAFSLAGSDADRKVTDFIRTEHGYDLFYNARERSCRVETSCESLQIAVGDFNHRECLSVSVEGKHRGADARPTAKYYAGKDFRPIGVDGGVPGVRPQVLRYSFKPSTNLRSTGGTFFCPPFGENLIDVLSYNPKTDGVKRWLSLELSKYGMEYVLDKAGGGLRFQRRLSGNEVFQLPYSSVADTLQRLLFYKTAIASNQDSILLFEEPEAHAFPPYIATLTNDIIGSTSNQFFITTHSPFVVNDFIEEKRDDVAVFIVGYKDNQTTARRLSEPELDEVYNHGIDLFFNIENYL